MALPVSSNQPVPHFGGANTTSLYVGDLQPDVTEAILFEIFSQTGPVSSIRVCRDSVTRRSLGYAYVNFHSFADAERALELLNYTPIKGVPCRLMWSYRDPSLRKDPTGNLFVKNLSPNIDNKSLADTFSRFGSILSCKVAVDDSGKSKGFGFVHFANPESAADAINNLNDTVLDGVKLYVGPFERRQERAGGKFTNVYVKNIPHEWSLERFQKEFEKFGKINSICLPEHDDKSLGHKGFGYVNYQNHEEALAAVEQGVNIPTGDLPSLYVNRFQKKVERKINLEKDAAKKKREIAEKTKNLNLYVKNLEDDVDDNRLKEIFSEYGKITSAVVMRGNGGVSRGFGFVCFENEADAEKALNQMKMRTIGKKPLYVAKAQRKEERRMHLENEFQTSMVQRMQYSQLLYPPTAVPVPQAGIFYPQIFPQRRFPMQRTPMYQTTPTAPNYAQQARRAGAPVSTVVRGGPYYGQPQGGVIPSNRGGSQRGRGGMASRNHQPPVTPAPIVPQSYPGQDLTALLASAEAPERQKNILGERLFPLIHKDYPQLAGKITGMLLEMEVSEILQLLESPTDRNLKIQEAIEVLNSAR